ncbi:MAG: class I SAM-dependent methyltransferase [Pseudomonadota bacterium]
MGLIFDTESATAYESWYRSPQGRAIDRSLEALIRGLLDPEPGDRVLDIGSGTGNHLLLLSKMGMNVSGIEASPHLIHKAKQRLGHGCTLKEGFAEDLPFDDNEFDMAVLINTLEFLDEPLEALREAGRVASKKVFVGVINSLSWNGLLKRTQGYLGDPLFCHARFYNLWQLRSLLRTAYGPVPISWGCVKVRPPFLEKIRPFGKEVLAWERSPFGTFLGVSATMIYGVRTDNLPLKMRLQKASQSLFGENTLLGLNGKEGD